VTIVIVLVLIAVFLGLVGFITDFLWFRELSYTSVFWKKLVTQLEIGVPLFIVLTVVAYFYLLLLKKGYMKRISTAGTSVRPRILNWIALGLSALAALAIAGISVSSLWFEALKFMNSTEFAIKDPIFNLDVGFYVFKLQFITQVNQLVISIIIALAVLTAIYYFVLISLCKPKVFETRPGAAGEEEEQDAYSKNFGNDPYSSDVMGKVLEGFMKAMGMDPAAAKPQGARGKMGDSNFKELLNIAAKQLVVLGVLFFIMLGVSFFLRQYDLLYSRNGVLFGAGFTDINVTLWMYRILMVMSLVAAVFFAIGVRSRRYRTVLTVPVIMIIIGILGSGVGAVVQNLVVSPDALNKEGQYLANNIRFTQSAYDLQSVQTKPFSSSNTLTAEDIQNNGDTLSNIRINDYLPVKQFYNNTQTMRQYYSFNDVDVDRYMVNGEYTQTYLSAREVDETKIDQQWINKYLKYTHGYGITLSRVDRVTTSGQPDIMIKDIPPLSDVDEIKITQPEIYFGELTNNYILVKTDELEYDYPSGTENALTTYGGKAGISLNLFNRSLFAIREQSLKLLVSTNVNSSSRIVINRNIAQRVREIMPYLAYDDNPYIVTVDGKLYWIIDAYTTSSKYPYSEPFTAAGTVNYIRNSVKVVVDAYNGDTDYYLVDDKDPVANTFMNIYPKLFHPFEEMPDGIREHIRYPGLLLEIQANVYRRYHVGETNVPVFYQSEDLWDIAKEVSGENSAPEAMSSQYYIMKLPGESDVEFINSIPFTPRDKVVLTGLLVARSDGEHYGELILYQMPKTKTVWGPEQIEALISQDQTISQDFSLWRNSDSTNYTRGNMFVIPIEEALIYVEPIYLAAVNSSIPEVRRVIVYYDEKLAYESTLGEALESLFGTGASGAVSGGSASGTPGGTSSRGGADAGSLSQADLILRANEAYENAVDAQKDGDWAAYGRELANLERYLKQLLPEQETEGLDAVLDELSAEAETVLEELAGKTAEPVES
jgi:uncharacterized membrane protein (UPF0182 family)